MASIVNSGKKPVLPNVNSTGQEVATAAAKAGHTLKTIYGSNNYPDHNTLRCLDFMVSHLPKAQWNTAGDWIADYLWTNRDRLGLRLILWRQRIISTYSNATRKAGVWTKMADRGSATENHMDHVHAEFEQKTYKAPAVTTPPKTPPATTGNYTVKSGDTLWALANTWKTSVDAIKKANGLKSDLLAVGQKLVKPGSSSSTPAPAAKVVSLANLKVGKDHADVKVLQQALIAAGHKIPDGPTTYYGAQTKAAVTAFQKKQGWSGADADGIPGKGTLQRLGLTER